MKIETPRRLFFDIETSPNLVLSWRVGYRLSIQPDAILRERAVICIGYKFQGEKTKVISWDKNQSDKEMLAEFVEIVSQADECIGHNVDRYDLPWVRTRCLFHKLPALPLFDTVDTLQWARRRYNFNSNKLDYIADFLGIGRKIKTEFKLWKDVVLDNDADALARMKRYCAGDVDLLEKVYERLAVSGPAKVHAGVYAGRDKWSCPRCASEAVHKCRPRITAKGSFRQQMVCKDCGGYYDITHKAMLGYERAKKRTK